MSGGGAAPKRNYLVACIRHLDYIGNLEVAYEHNADNNQSD